MDNYLVMYLQIKKKAQKYFKVLFVPLNTMIYQEWIPLVVSKQAAFHGMAEYYQSCVAAGNKSYGEQISRLKVRGDVKHWALIWFDRWYLEECVHAFDTLIDEDIQNLVMVRPEKISQKN